MNDFRTRWNDGSWMIEGFAVLIMIALACLLFFGLIALSHTVFGNSRAPAPTGFHYVPEHLEPDDPPSQPFQINIHGSGP